MISKTRLRSVEFELLRGKESHEIFIYVAALEVIYFTLGP